MLQLTYMGNQIMLHYTSIHLVNEIQDSLWALVSAEFEILFPITNYQRRATTKQKCLSKSNQRSSNLSFKLQSYTFLPLIIFMVASGKEETYY